MTQLDMFAALEPRPTYVRETREVVTGAFGKRYVMEVDNNAFDPEVIEVRGIPTLIKFGFGWSTYTMQKPGSLYWSETGFRSFSCSVYDADSASLDEIAARIERYIDAPAKDGNGCGGKLVKWWPGYVNQWRNNEAFARSYKREDTWAQWGPEKHKECWDNHDRKQAEALAKMRKEGIDPDEVGPPSHFKGKWPTFAQGALF